MDMELPTGFRVNGVRCGISATAGKKDMALFISERPARAAGVFTQNLFAAAPVQYCREVLRDSPSARAVLINSGCANACTGARGAADVALTAKTLAVEMGWRSNDVLVASTGVIGRHLPRPALLRGVQELARWAQKGTGSSVANAVRAIMTTDTRPKTASAVFPGGKKSYRLWGCAKGAGMIHPNMATMLSVILTDAPLPARNLASALALAARRTFNCISVDGDTSTNDSLIILANGVGPALGAKGKKSFASALEEVCFSLSTQIASDGEGARRLAWIFVQGAKTESDAHRLAATVATSPLVKTALHGADPNWGRILAALGRAGVAFDPNKVDVRIGDIVVCRRGGKADYSEPQVHRLLKKDRVTVVVDLHQGRAWSRYATCDFSKDYVAINADYTT